MPTWGYDSYCNDNVMDYVEDFSETELFARIESDIEEYLKEGIYEMNLEFVLGIGICCLRKGKKMRKKILCILRQIIEYLLENGKFTSWVDPENRRIKLRHEKKIVENFIVEKPLTFDKLKLKPKKFTDLNPEYYN